MEYLYLQTSLGARLDSLGPTQKSFVIGFLGSEDMVELQRMLGLRVRERASKSEHQGGNEFHRQVLRRVR